MNSERMPEQSVSRTRAHSLLGDMTRRTASLLLILGQLVLAAAVLFRLDMFNSAFRRVFCLAVIGFVVNALLPARFRLRFFVLLSAAALLLVLGGVPGTTWDTWTAVVRFAGFALSGALVIAICFLPLNFWLRVALLSLLGLGFATFRSGTVGPDSLLAVWPLFASFFMFRAIVFIYEMSVTKSRPKPSEVLSYFLLLPNSGSALFPVVDFRTLVRSHYPDSKELELYQRGVNLVFRGLLHLIAYRFVNQLVSMEATAVTNGAQVIQFIAGATFTYLQVSGLFHLLVGMLVLFGFNLPDTNRRYFLASSFTDYWRRVNIYWKDFILKVFYNPTYFRLRRLGPMRALIGATLWSFFVTWLLHLYQTWWLKGGAQFSVTDALFWGILAVLILVNSVWELKRGRPRTLVAVAPTVASGAWLALRTVATFATIAVLWSLWATPTLAEWLTMWSFSDVDTVLWASAVLLVIALAKVLIEIIPWSTQQSFLADFFRRTAPTPAAVAAVLMFVLVADHVGTRGWTPSLLAQQAVDVLHTGDSMTDTRANRGYYQRLGDKDEGNQHFWEMLHRRRAEYAYAGSFPVLDVSDFREHVLQPNVDMEAYDTRIRTNAWGMRDSPVDLRKPTGAVRIAVLGSSHTIGWGVLHEQTFESLLESRLAKEPLSPLGARRVELLNFAFPGYGPLAQELVLEKSAARFQPDVVLYVAHLVDGEWVVRDLAGALKNGVTVTDPVLQKALRDARITERTPQQLAAQRLQPAAPALLAHAYAKLARSIRAADAVARVVVLPVPTDLPLPANAFDRQIAKLRRAGFGVYDLRNVFSGMAAPDLMVDEGWKHTNPLGHRIIANALYKELAADTALQRAIASTPVSAQNFSR